MLYDAKRWDKRAATKFNVFSLDGLIAWLETQPADRKYNYWDCGGRCLLGQYLTAHGLAGEDSPVYIKMADIETRQGKTIQDEVAFPSPHTFGAALERARSILSNNSSDVQERT